MGPPGKRSGPEGNRAAPKITAAAKPQDHRQPSREDHPPVPHAAAVGLPPCGERTLWLWIVGRCPLGCGGSHAHRGGRAGGIRRAGCDRGWYRVSARRRGRAGA